MKRNHLLPLIVILSLLLTSCNNFGDKVKKGHIEAYYKEGVNKNEALRTAELLYNIDMTVHNPTNRKSFQLCKIHDTVCLRMIVSDDYYLRTNEENFLMLANYVSDSAFNGTPVNVDLTDKYFKSKKFIPYKKMDLSDDK